jgi:hypothetical protein
VVENDLSPEEREALLEREELKEDVLFFLVLTVFCMLLGYWLTT